MTLVPRLHYSPAVIGVSVVGISIVESSSKNSRYRKLNLNENSFDSIDFIAGTNLKKYCAYLITGDGDCERMRVQNRDNVPSINAITDICRVKYARFIDFVGRL